MKRQLAQCALGLLDLTRLEEADSPEVISSLCQSAHTSFGQVAAVCVYPKFVAVARDALDSQKLSTVRLATVVNFPEGGIQRAPIRATFESLQETRVDEIDFVFPYRSWLEHRKDEAIAVLSDARDLLLPDQLLKVIIESGAFEEAGKMDLLPELCACLEEMGVDFIKTSTGKISRGSSLKAAKIILDSTTHVGIKLSGGIRTLDQVGAYLTLIEESRGPKFISPHKVRFGASQLYQEIVTVLTGEGE